MKPKDFSDLREFLDEIFTSANEWKDSFANDAKQWFESPMFNWNEHKDYYPNHSYPPANVYLNESKSIVFEFALAGFEQSSINLEFRGDYMILSAKAPESDDNETRRYLKRRLRLKDIEEIKYFAPADKFDRENVQATFKNSILKVVIPPVDAPEQGESIRVNIFNED